eukprot:1608875-Amphidinium_carterae.1
MVAASRAMWKACSLIRLATSRIASVLSSALTDLATVTFEMMIEAPHPLASGKTNHRRFVVR